MKLILFLFLISTSVFAGKEIATFEIPLIKAMTYTGRMVAAKNSNENYEVYVTHYQNIVTVVLNLKKGHVENLKERDTLAQAVIDKIAEVKKKYKDTSITVRVKI